MTLVIKETLSLLEEGRHVILHGPGGTGKTYTISRVVEEFRRRGLSYFQVPVTAFTGVAAVILSQQGVSARTLSSWAGIKTGEKEAEVYAKILDASARKRWMDAIILIIDEISMVPSQLLDKLDIIGRLIRKNPLPFGGIKIVFCGDFLQNPPIPPKKGYVRVPPYSFLADVWGAIDLTWIELEIPRRYSDMTWFEMLLRFRSGTQTSEDLSFLKTRFEAWNKLLIESKGKLTIIPTILESRKIDVEVHNQRELEALPGEATEYHVFYTFNKKKGGGSINKEAIMKLFELQIPAFVNLKPGAQVMLKYNLDVDLQLVNGSRGVVLEINASGVHVLWTTGRKTWVVPHTWEMEDEDGIYTSTQIPLILAWSITIHKSQGSTLDCVVLNLKGLFADGQGYVGLSRVRTKEGLYISGLSATNKIKASKVVLEFLEQVRETPTRKVIPEFFTIDTNSNSLTSSTSLRILSPYPPLTS